MKLSEKQKDLLEWVESRINEEGEEYFYCEYGQCKPFNKKTVIALEEKGLIRAEWQCDGVYYLYLPDSPERVKDLEEKLDDFENEMNEILAPSLELIYPPGIVLDVKRVWSLAVIDEHEVLYCRYHLAVDPNFVDLAKKIAKKHDIGEIDCNNDRSIIWA